MTFELKHYDYWPSSQAALIALLEQGNPYTITTIDMSKQEQNAPAFQALTPYGAPPVLVDPTHTHGPNSTTMKLWDPVAICIYANNNRPSGKSPVLNPADPCEYAVAIEWAVWAQKQLMDPLETYLQNVRLLPSNQRDPTLAQYAASAITAALTKLEAWMPDVSTSNKFLACPPGGTTSAFSLADVLVGAATNMIKVVYSSMLPSGTYPKTYAYNGMLAARSSWQTAFANVTP